MYRIFVFLIAITLIQPVYAKRTVITNQPYYNPYYNNQTAYYGGDYIPEYYKSRKRVKSRFYDINNLEKYALNKNYYGDSDRLRLERLEMQAFGAIQSGDLHTRYKNVRDAILTRPKQNYKTSIIRNIGDYFSGQMTGFTPSIYPQTPSIDDYPTFFGKNSADGYITPWGKGFRSNNYGITSSSGIHILD